MAKTIPVAIWTHPADSITCDLCWSLLGVYQGMVFIIGSPEYWAAMGIFHPNCRFLYIYSVIPIKEMKTIPAMTEAIPADSPTWDIAFFTIVPIEALSFRTDRIAVRPIRRKQGAIQEGTPVFSREAYQSAKQKLRELIRKGELTLDVIYDRLVRKFGVNGILAYNESGL